MTVPETSTTLLRDIAGSAENPRWGEFVARYRPALEAFVAERFPGLDAGDMIQETFIAIARALPDYRYDPEEKGRFHSYLTGILHHKCLNALRSDRRRKAALGKCAAEAELAAPASDEDMRQWRETVYELALQQLMANPDISARDKQIFVRTATKGEKAEAVAMSLAVSRDVVYMTKARMLARLREIIGNLKGADEV